MKGYGQFCPVAVASEVFAQRWTPLILRELVAGATHFNEIRRGLPLMSRTLLTQRLRSLERLGIVRSISSTGRVHAEYQLTSAGAGFAPVLQLLGQWGQRWAVRFDPQNLDAEFLMWNIRRRLALDQLPDARVLTHFRFCGLPPGYRRGREFWLITEHRRAELCLKDPGGEVDLLVATDIGAFARMWLGELSFAQLQQQGGIQVSGARELVRSFPSWLRRSQFAKDAEVRR
jgi:DNA-binding HxlR family transcriptional regulator